MFIDILSNPIVATSINVFTMVCFAVVFLLALKNWRNHTSVFIVASVLLVSFVATNDVVIKLLSTPAKPDNRFYLRWVEYEAFSVVAIIALHLVTQVKMVKYSKISMWLLLANACYHFAMHVDIILSGNREPWFLWIYYIPVTTLVELIIAGMLFWVAAKNFTEEQSVTQ